MLRSAFGRPKTFPQPPAKNALHAVRFLRWPSHRQIVPLKAMAKTCWFVVLQSGGRWWVDCEGKAYGPFPDGDTAKLDAIKLARSFGDPLRQSMVFAHIDGEVKLIWAGPLPERGRS
jgi:hypothetical protein